jgi:hypothetical protein
MELADLVPRKPVLQVLVSPFGDEHSTRHLLEIVLPVVQGPQGWGKPGKMSFTRTVPACVPSLLQSPLPLFAFPVKNRVPSTFTKLITRVPAGRVLMSLTRNGGACASLSVETRKLANTPNARERPRIALLMSQEPEARNTAMPTNGQRVGGINMISCT